MLDNWAQLPFREHWKLYITSIPYNVEVSGGDVITSDFEQNSLRDAPSEKTSEEMVGLAIEQLKTVRPGSLRVVGSKLATHPRSSVLVLVSVARKDNDKTLWRSLFQVFTKALSITVFVFGTCVLSAVSLLAMPMAQLVLMLILAAGVGSRVISGGIVTAVAKNEPMIHVITDTKADAFKVMTEIFALQQQPKTKFQIELQGHIFVEGKRVAKRSLWIRRVLGVIASPYSLVKAEKHRPVEGISEEIPLQSKYIPSSTSARSDGFGSDEILPAPRIQHKTLGGSPKSYKGAPQVELRRFDSYEVRDRHSIQRKPAPARHSGSGEYQGLQDVEIETPRPPYHGT